MSCRALLTLACILGALAQAKAGGDALPPPAFDRVVVAPTKTSIYIGTVSLTMPTFVRVQDRYETTYTARVFPFFMYNEAGRLSVDISDEGLRQLERGEPVEFSGRAVNADGDERRVEGKATPADAAGGKIKVRVFVSRHVELIFNTTYRFAAGPPAPAT
jgi:hypothetical protein